MVHKEKGRKRSHSQEIVDVDLLPAHPKRKKCSMWVQNSLYNLSGDDREILLSPVGWLNDSIISAAQALLKQCLISGFQPPSIGMTMEFVIQQSEFIQILHDGHNHWLTISTVGCCGPEIKFMIAGMTPLVHGRRTKLQLS